MNRSERPLGRRQVVMGAVAVLGAGAGARAARAQAFNREALIEGAKREGHMVWYTGAPEQLATAVLREFNRKYPFIDVSQYFRQTAGRLQARLQAETDVGKNVADTLASGDVGMFIALKNQFAPIESPELGAYADEYKDRNLWAAWRVTLMMIGYNPTRVRGDDVPKSWNDLANPRFAGRIGFQDSTAGLMHVEWYALRQAMGPGFWERVAQNKPVVLTGSLPIVEAVLRGELLLDGNSLSYFAWSFGQRDGAPYKGVVPAEGVPLGFNPIAILKNAPNPNAARLFVDWLLSAEGQRVMVRETGDYSPRGDVAAAPGNAALSDVKTIRIASWDDVNSTRDEFVRQWTSFPKR